MAQGKAFTKEQKDEIINSLKTYLQLGYSRNRACDLIGLTPQTLSLWLKADEALLMKVVAWENEINALARKNWRESIRSGNIQDSKDWLERRDREDFGRNVDITSKNNPINGIEVVFKDFSDDVASI